MKKCWLTSTFLCRPPADSPFEQSCWEQKQKWIFMSSKRCFEKSVLYKVSITMFLSYEYFQHHNITIAELWNQNPRFWKTAAGRHKNVNFFNIFFKISILGNNCCLKLWEDVHLIFLRPQLRGFAFKHFQTSSRALETWKMTNPKRVVV